MNHPIGTALFLLAVLTNFVLITVGLAWGIGLSTYRGARAFQQRTLAASQLQAAYHHVDVVRTTGFEKLFIAAAFALVLAGLPIALAAIFHFMLPLLGSAWSP
ncbi:MAG TPA: hypothetical protein VGL13_10730, partial [Polyangiaceae bacterium]